MACSVACIVPAQAAADDAADARVSFEEGLELLDDGRYADATRAFERSLALREAPATLYNLGLAHRGAGENRRAIAAFERFVEVYGERAPRLRADAQTILEELRASLARVRIELRGEPEELFVDGSPVALDEVRELVLDPGSHHFEARRAGYAPARAERDLEPGSETRLTLDVAAHPRFATLSLDARPLDARVRIDGTTQPSLPLELRLAPGAHRIEATSPGHEAFARELNLSAGASQRLTIALTPIAPRLEQEWWLWTLVAGGALAVAAAITAAILVPAADAPYDGGSTMRVLFGLGS